MLRYVLLLILVVPSAYGILCAGSRQNSSCVSARQRLTDLLFFKTVCYPRVGCFYNGPPFYHPIRRPISVPPKPPEKIGPKFYLYTRRNRDVPVQIFDGDRRTLRQSPFNPRAFTRFLSHGYIEFITYRTALVKIKDAILDQTDDNVILMEWISGAVTTYFLATANTRVVGAMAANLIRFIMNETGMPPERFHLIGHSLAAHLYAYVGQRIKNIGRITGLDPAGPNYAGMADEVVMDRGDALFVDSIHTDRGELIIDGFGVNEDDGQVDFWPWNGKIPLSVCLARYLYAVFQSQNPVAEVIINAIECRHYMSFELFHFSFNQSGCLYVGVKCRTWEEFRAGLCDCGDRGERCNFLGFFARPPTAEQTDDDFRHYLVTSNFRPYCVHQYVLTVYVHNFQPNKNLRNEKDYQEYGAEILLLGKENVLKTKINLHISTTHQRQALRFLLTNRKPLGRVYGASIDLKHSASLFGIQPSLAVSSNVTRYSLERLKVTYLYPRPRTETESTLCRLYACPRETCGNQILFEENVCQLPLLTYE